ncbi:hypothetical protein WAI453_003787 [Rhynchosporium graminicola]
MASSRESSSLSPNLLTKFTEPHSPARVTKPQSKSVYECLPAEIRQMITAFAIQQDRSIEWIKGSKEESWRVRSTKRLNIASIAATSRLMYKDIKTMELQFYRFNSFCVPDFCTGFYWLDRILENKANAIRTLSTTLESVPWFLT